MVGFTSDVDPLGLVCFLLGTGGKIEWSDGAARALTPAGAGSLQDLVAPEDRTVVGDLLLTAAATGRAVGIVRLLEPVGGALKYFQLILTPADGYAAGVGYLYAATAGAVGASGPGPGDRPKILTQAWDVTGLVRQHQELEVYAFRDALTGVANRRTFMTILDQEVDLSRRSRPPVAVLYADVDDFKKVNDLYGHHAGDLVLVELASRLAAMLRPEDTLARIGGDEFAVICPKLTGWSAAAVIVDRLRAAAAEPISLSRATLSVTLSIGVAFAEEHPDAPDAAADLLARADSRMFHAKFAARTPSDPQTDAPSRDFRSEVPR